MADRLNMARLARRSARWSAEVPVLIAYAGLLPMLVAGLATVSGGLGPLSAAAAVTGLKSYSAVALGFLGGIRWGMAMRVETGTRGAMLIAASVLPAIVAWVALLLPDIAGLGLLAVGLAGLGAWDVWTIDAGGGPSWYGRVRLRVTLIATAVLAIAVLSLG